MDIFKVSGKTIREMRDAVRWTREKLSEESDVPARTIEDIETGASKNPSLLVVQKLLGALPKPKQTNNELLGIAVTLLATLNESELRDVIDFIEDSRSLSSGSARSTKVR